METISKTSPRIGSMADFRSGEIHNKQFIFVLNHINQQPSFTSSRGVGVHYPPSVTLKLIDEIFDKEKRMMRTIRYIKGETSIYKDEQTSDDKNPKKLFSIEFINGEKIVSGRDALLVKFLMLTNKNGSNPDRDPSVKARFLTVDPGQGLQSVIDEDEKLAEAQQFCYKGDWDEVAAYAMVMGVNMDRDPREIRYALRQIAGKDPDKFMAGMKSPSFKRKYYVLQALSNGIIVKNAKRNSIEWANSDGSPVATAPIGRDVVDYFVEATFTPDGERVFAAIMDILRPDEKVVAPSSLVNVPSADEIEKLKQNFAPKPKDIIQMADITNMKLAELIRKGEEQGVIVKSGAWKTFEGVKYQGDDLFKTIKGSEDLLRTLQERLN